MLFELLHHLVLLFDADIFQIGDGLGNLLDLVVGEKLHDLASGFLAESDEEDTDLLHCRYFRLFVLVGGGIVATIFILSHERYSSLSGRCPLALGRNGISTISVAIGDSVTMAIVF